MRIIFRLILFFMVGVLLGIIQKDLYHSYKEHVKKEREKTELIVKLQRMEENIIRGDTACYEELNMDLPHYGISPVMICLYSFVMANKYNYSPAYCDLNLFLTDILSKDCQKKGVSTAEIDSIFIPLYRERCKYFNK